MARIPDEPIPLQEVTVVDSGSEVPVERRMTVDRRVYSYDRHYPERRKRGDRRAENESLSEEAIRSPAGAVPRPLVP
ncbi:hypothetical protein MSL71_19670 [Desulfoluna butyratoxydans]|uniref:Uncharacterized protein n=1 Tax=Desulfoluna butyratoxydans TaxID=231438 RepID=A0A4U8YKY1_9BACT|nr:hypothetical protein MSL71_19670 [Desulfoluna butyratoxydans]